MEKYSVVFLPDNKKVTVDKGTTLLSAAISAHIHLNSVCGGDGVCGRCKVIVRSGSVHSQGTGKITPSERKREVYLACQTLVESDLEVEIPLESRLDLSALSKEELELRLRGVYSKAEDISEAEPSFGEGLFAHAPLVTKICLKLSRPNFDDKISDLERVYRAVQEKIGEKPIQTGLSNIRHLGELLRASDWTITVGVAQVGLAAEIVSIEPQDVSSKNYGIALDIGTTTISGQLVDLNKKTVLGTKAAYNRQASFGSDVISRIIYSKEKDGLEKLHHAVIDVANEMIENLSSEHGIDLNDITVIAVAGNTTMIHLLLRVDPTYIRQEPYVPTANYFPRFKAAEAGLKINPHGLLFCLPGVASYVGGDITAGIVASEIYKRSDLSLLIDIGTNGEIALGNKEWIMSCAASAGPAFEGSGVSCGLRATRGAIQEVRIDSKTLDVEYLTIGGDKPRGICGSGYISLICELLKIGALDKSGKLNRDMKSKRLRQGEFDYEFVVVFDKDSATGSDIVITDSDVDNLKRAKAAIYSGISILLRHMNLDAGAIKKIFVAGGFGTSLNIEKAVNIGLLPDIESDRFLFVGNSSLAGARQVLLSGQAVSICDEVAAGVTYYELSTDPEYMDEYMAALFFPHTDIKRFPSVKYV